VFNSPVNSGAYAWWYLDALSDDGRFAIALIAFIGCVFSPSYFRARKRGSADPYDYGAMNVALYGSKWKRWAMTEYRCSRSDFTDHAAMLGRNQLSWDGEYLQCHVDEIAAPVPLAIRGEVYLYPEVVSAFTLPVDRNHSHWWQPLVPRARVEVDLQSPRIRWSGTGYLDTNRGSVPLDSNLTGWTWQRAHSRTQTRIIYDIRPLSGEPITHGLSIGSSGRVEPLLPPPAARLSPTFWRIPREARADNGYVPRVITTLEDAPFYARSLVDTRIDSQRVMAVHESLSLTRFRSPWVRAVLPFRMRRSLTPGRAAPASRTD
jgi:carotenoid 1,2-hydratase